MKPKMELITRNRVLTALAAVAALAAAVLVVGPGYEAAQVHMRTGTVWLASSQTGEATLVDGASAEVKAHAPVAGAGTALTVAQHGSAAVVLNRGTGQLRRIDGATENVSPPMEVLPASDGLVTASGPDVLYVADVHSGQVTSVDPAGLTTRHEPERLADGIRPDDVVVDDRGTLWAIDDTTGDLVWLTDGERRNRATATRNVRLTVTDGKPALVDTENDTAELLNPETGDVARSVRLDLPGDAVALAGSADRARVLIATGRGELSWCAFGSGCVTPVQVGSAGADLGTPVEVDNHAVVPDYSTGQATIVDLTTSQVIAQRQLFDQPTRFELIVRDGIVFFNDPNSNAAGVLDLSGDIRTIVKYTPAEHDSTPAPDRPGKADQVAKSGQQKQGLGLPRQSDVPFQPKPPAPAPAVSIEVKPDNHGVVGDEFELTARFQDPGDSAVTWSFGDGTGGTGTTVRHSWREAGFFTVRATVSLAGGKQLRAETVITVDPASAPPHITALNLSPAKPVIGQQVRFSADTAGSPVRWAWSVTAQGSSAPEVTAQTPTFVHAFTTPGTYTVTLTIAGNGRTAEFSRQLTVSQGAVKFWGGRDDHRDLKTVPEDASSGVVAIDGGDHHALALNADGRVIAWGDDDEHEPTNVPSDALSGVIAISAGQSHSLALKADGRVLSWGAQFDDLQTVPQEALRGVKAIAAGSLHSLALTENGRVIAWGDDTEQRTAVPDAALSDVTAIAAGGSHSLALKADGTVLTWGYSASTNLEVPAEATSGVVAIAAGDARSLVVKADGTIIQWGHVWEGEAPAPPAVHGFRSVDMDSQHALLLKEDGSVLGWGGPNNNGEASVPSEFGQNVLAIAAGAQFSLAVVDG
ncbi:PKD domain-containing protein [Lentzea terrae]|uniref:PKD domain-containing protein n=1 Tax=Lentzea terrae TaxID=2200761 RepID=UPI000DD4323F|nr:PKD domain-containing protein [Lentzea terrae]